MQTTFTISTEGPGLYEFTGDVAAWVRGTGLCTLFIRHTSASLLIQENADPDVRRDLAEWLHRTVPPADHPDMGFLTHVAEGPDDMPAHLKAAILPVNLQIPVTRGALALGTWQGIYLVEHRDAPHRRQVVAHMA
ncbi:secondary thiamine-phosphate synthase enzyme YjbQ [Citreimonas sp.]|uniref:secondary thiamine-phosphate synthase enzyme YjbQ n=1 Tax=Citreimonas sp. TaxID=3036715 RepID=UPI0040598A41